MFLAKALYDNIAESPDELAFRRGDVLTVTELDTCGLDGWWLCVLRGKQGIAPGNRLKILSGMSDYSCGDESVSSSNENLASRRSWDLSSKSFGMVQDVYDEPNKGLQDYDVPPSRYQHKESTDRDKGEDSSTNVLKLETEGACNVYADKGLSGSELSAENLTQVYDIPQPHGRLLVVPDDTSCSNRSSTLSTGSTESSAPATSSALSSKRSSSIVSVSDSARSSLDASSQEMYDTPNRSKSSKQVSVDSGLDIYDTPPKARLASPSSVIEDYDFPRKDHSSLCKVSTQTFEQKLGTKVVEHALDDVYDVPKNNMPRVQVKSFSGKTAAPITEAHGSHNEGICVYDIPPQVTRDSVISCRSDSSEEGQRLSTCSMDSKGSLTEIPTYNEMPIEMDAALELLTKLQQDVMISVSRFSGFVSSTWRKRESLQTKLFDIKLASTSVKNSLADFIDFSQGTLGNSAKLPDKKLVNKLYKQLNPLQNSLQLISSALRSLDDIKWQIDILAEPLDSTKSDDLGQIAGLCKDLITSVRKLASLIQGNATLLFSKAYDIENICKDKRSSAESFAAGKPPIGPKPEVGPKRSRMVQQRPLPAPPTANRPLPPTPIEDEMNSLRIRFQEQDKVTENLERDGIYANDSSEWTREYDYVHLESKDIVAQIKIKEDQLHCFEKESSPDPSEQDLKDKVEDPYESKLEADLEELDSTSKQGENDNDSFEIESLLETDITSSKLENNILNKIEKENCDNSNSDQLNPNDKQVLVFYSGQMETHSTLLDNALDAFFSCVESNEPPKVFISHSKFVIVSAHKLVYIGDTLHRNIMHANVKNKIMLCANQLCECLKLSVSATKLAALQYPSVPAVQEMVDRVLAVSKAARNLKFIISQASSH